MESLGWSGALTKLGLRQGLVIEIVLLRSEADLRLLG